MNPPDKGFESHAEPIEPRAVREQQVARLRVLWEARKLLLRVLILGAIASAAIVLLVPVRYEATAQLMPPDGQAGSGMAMLSAFAGRASAMSGMASDLLGVKNSGALFVGILQSRTVEDRLIEQFGLLRTYRVTKMEDARIAVASHTRIAEDRKSGIITITVTDRRRWLCRTACLWFGSAGAKDLRCAVGFTVLS